ncbi:regulatory-associated protein of mTOR [Achlya hypogyna]|uniref:Regulatory-associated protein of mTOR n=1 Tax=Achlya hypogyna TaxID=1202772 RepID=A0A1V9Z1N3_ACHHY|nr:regulatory-associated protein of mTOR [Achlya hypogyna]
MHPPTGVFVRPAPVEEPVKKRPYVMEDRHLSKVLWGEKDDDDEETAPIQPWRMGTPRLKTMDVALVLCLNIGTDPPDVVKPSPCARKECWVEPFSMPAQKALETIGKTLQSQYERWQPRARYRQSLDPTVDEIKQLCVSLRRHAKHDRVLFHYNGHGVPRPTVNGEIWVFNKSYTQYIPLLVYELQAWVGTPSIYVFDCSSAGVLLQHFSAATDAFVLAACGPDEILPMQPDMCADVFTSCLTTPITVALRWFLSQNERSMGHLEPSVIDRIPGKLTDRKTPLGELNWIFTAITDTIAWNLLPAPLFQTLFRQDLLVASLFRNFLLAERIMTTLGAAAGGHALTAALHAVLAASAAVDRTPPVDLAAETCLSQLQAVLAPPSLPQEITFHHSRFFAEQLMAFEVWLQFGSKAKPPPQQLPIILQMLLNQALRVRALVLLTHFFDLGPHAVNLTLSVGIFPYVERLLQSPAPELRHVLVFVWTKIVALDPSCQADLVKIDGQQYFLNHLMTPLLPPDQKAMALFVLSVLCHEYPAGQQACLQHGLLKRVGPSLQDAHPLAWERYEPAKAAGLEDRCHAQLHKVAQGDASPEVRAAAVFALGTLLGTQFRSTNAIHAGTGHHPTLDLPIASECLVAALADASPIVRKEAVLALAQLVLHPRYQPPFERLARQSDAPPEPPTGPQAAHMTAVWLALQQVQQRDPFTPLRPLVKTLVSRVETLGHTASPTTALPGRPAKAAQPPESPALPPALVSSLYKWASAKFNRPLLESADAPEADELDPLSPQGAVRLERQRRTARWKLLASQLRVDKEEQLAAYGLTLRQSALLSTEADMTSLLVFHPYERPRLDSLLVVADATDQVSVWDVDASERRLAFGNLNPRGSRLTALGWLNPDDRALLLCGSDDGVVKLYHDVESAPRLALAFAAVPDLTPGTRGSGLVTAWQQHAGMLFAGGNAAVVRGWDLQQERCVFQAPTQTDACATTLATDEASGGLVVAGCGDGSLRLYDPRTKADVKAVLREHSAWIVGTHLYPGKYELLSGSVTGELKFWDLRYHKTSVRTLEAHRSPMTALAVHNYAPVFARSSGSHNQFIKVFRHDGEQLALIRYHEGFLGERIGPVSCLAFHPHRLLLAAGATDSLIALYSGDKA